MQGSTLLQEGVMLMAFGMGFVVVFLTLLVFATSLMSWVVARLVPVPAMPTPLSAQTTKTEDDNDVLVAISAAIHRHRGRDSGPSSS